MEELETGAAETPGEARCPGAPSVGDIIAADGDGAPAFLSEQYRYIATDRIDFDRYSSADYRRLEAERLWPKCWLFACREDDLREVGDYKVFEVGTLSLLIVQAEQGLRAYVNACLHRGTKLKSAGSDGWMSEIRCPFHGWAWALDGHLQRIPCAWDFPGVSARDNALPQARLECWGGFVFVNPDGEAPPLHRYLDVLPEHFRAWPLDDRIVSLHIQKELPCNWKLAVEAFIENYHTAETHPQLLRGGGDANTQYDVFGDNVGRFIAPKGVNSPSLGETLGEAELLGTMVRDRSLLEGGGLAMPEGARARTVMADYLRARLGPVFGDLSGRSTSEMVDTIQYNLFPNLVLFLGPTLPFVYRFLPLGTTVDRCLFEILVLKPAPVGEPRPFPAAPVRVGPDESYAMVPGLDPALVEIFDQDTFNLRAQQEGILTTRRAAPQLADYAEIRIRQFNATLDRLLAEAP
jgi:nitrite reductase/ring-hydroxylating ferredoxin subunit